MPAARLNISAARCEVVPLPAVAAFSLPGFALAKSISSLSELDRKSTRLNSSHANISYAVFCLKKKEADGHGGRGMSKEIPDRAEDGQSTRLNSSYTNLSHALLCLIKEHRDTLFHGRL